MTVRKQPGQKQREALRLPRTSAGGTVCVQLPHGSRFHAAVRPDPWGRGSRRGHCIDGAGGTGAPHGGLRPQVLVLDALLTKPSVTQILQEISTMRPDPEPAVLVPVPVPEETAARKALGLFAQYRIMLRPYGMKNLFDEIYRMDAQRTTSIGSPPAPLL